MSRTETNAMLDPEIAPGVAEALQAYRCPDVLGFGATFAPVMFSAEWRRGEWRRGRLLPYGPLEIMPAARGLQYAEVVFEGLKAYRVGQARPNLFRAIDNCLRMQRSAERLCMPSIPRELFLQGLTAVTRACADFIPSRSGQSLYLRPFLFGTESGFVLRGSDAFCFVVIASPVEAYASGAPTVAIERTDIRAAVGGLGETKASANYAAPLRASAAAARQGHAVTLWLDAAEHRYVQELSGMNFFAVIDGELHTPGLDGTILPGVTRDSLIVLARQRGYSVHEDTMDINVLLAQIRDGRCSELFACGTAAIVMPISALADADGAEYRPSSCNVVAAELREALLAIQERRVADPFGWVHEIA